MISQKFLLIKSQLIVSYGIVNQSMWHTKIEQFILTEAGINLKE